MRVLLLNMPFVSLSRPAIGISILKARLAQEGHECVTGHPNLFLGERIGFDAYQLVDEKLSQALFLGDWLFAQHEFGDKLDTATYLATLEQHAGGKENYQTILGIRDVIGAFLHDCLERYDVASFDMIGFTSTFQQNLASLAMARLIKQRHPEKIIVFGGGNCEGVMGLELHRSFPFIDFVCSGESDHSFPELVRRLEAGEPLAGVPGLVARECGQSKVMAPADKVHNMDALPDPDFDDYFAEVKSGPLASRLKPSLLIETARGCWWGAKSHCTFCGLNGDTMVFRAKSAERAMAEIERQVSRYGIRHFQAVDNIIALDYFKTLLPALKQKAMGVTFFYEVKSNMKRDQVKLLREAGVLAVQPGIESLNSHVLKLMRKGVSAIQNIALLKWCRDYGIEVAWNLLYGFPGETAEDYQQTAAYVSAIPHLRAPGTAAVIRLDRFSPNFNQADQFGIVNIRPFSLYQYVYPLPAEKVANLAYFFEYQHGDGRKPESYLGPTLELVKSWREGKGGDLRKQYGGQAELVVADSRPGRNQMLYPFNGIQREVYEFCEEVRSRAAIQQMAEEKLGPRPDLAESLDRFLKQMEDLQLMVREGNQYLSIAVGAAA
ncbi:MAG: RiPP maturation radical SAM C-methyltransferase [Bryobacteraceae bacterium]|nr:RiPP maturation radical SAM C-methyltransferase [Bryobacteraceae bacterium]